MSRRHSHEDDDNVSSASKGAASSASEDNLKNLEWTDNLEALLARWSDEALSYAWLHVKSESKYRKLNYGFTIPIVVLSTLTGSINLAMSSMVPAEYTTVGNLATGTLSIFTGILGTLLNFFKYAQISESHRNASVQWHKFYRNIKTELSLERICRKSAPTFYTAAKSEMDRLLDSSPNIPSEITQKYRERGDRTSDVELPDIIGNLHRTKVYKGDSALLLNMDDLENATDLRDFQHTPTLRKLTENPLSSASAAAASAVKNTVREFKEGMKAEVKANMRAVVEDLKSEEK